MLWLHFVKIICKELKEILEWQGYIKWWVILNFFSKPLFFKFPQWIYITFIIRKNIPEILLSIWVFPPKALLLGTGSPSFWASLMLNFPPKTQAHIRFVSGIQLQSSPYSISEVCFCIWPRLVESQLLKGWTWSSMIFSTGNWAFLKEPCSQEELITLSTPIGFPGTRGAE